ncbi:hypothetical protein B0I35DRAFT_481520 [Stachybotrys elegans]|uniref:Uncharacterized protein n=1 Tax=Stachybotrys elegans TaxID=80388 RepID=A0A8K0SLL5_9HYPO|nr:hypothetical protein B0I35DRAFT_481520 [Stachybotrys elegans]
MFATQHYMDAMNDPARKRLREDEEDATKPGSFSEHRNKRLQCLPLRTSPKASQQTLPSSFETYPSHGEDAPRSHFSPWSSSPAPGHAQHDAEMEMMDDVNSPPAHSRMESFHTDPENPADTGRMPTPIQPSFAAQVRGQQCDWAASGSSSAPLNGTVNLGHHHAGFSDHGAIPRTMGSEANWQNVQNTRRLPSPISEAEDMAATQPCGDLHHHELAPHGEDMSAASHGMGHPNAMMDVESPHGSATHAGDSDGDPSSPSPSRRGHMRSKHTINNWTWQPGMKKSFSIGYRADCEKCRLKVPGHFNHIIIS